MPIEMTKFLAVSFSSFTKINRSVFYKLNEKGFNVTIIIPSRLKFGNLYPEPDLEDHLYVKTISLDLIGQNPRIHSFKGIIKLLNNIKPTIIYLENEPLSFLAIQLGIWCKLHGAKLYCQSLENIPISLRYSLKTRSLKATASYLYKKILSYAARPLVTHIFAINKDCIAIYHELGFKRINIPSVTIPKCFMTTLRIEMESKGND